MKVDITSPRINLSDAKIGKIYRNTGAPSQIFILSKGMGLFRDKVVITLIDAIGPCSIHLGGSWDTVLVEEVPQATIYGS